MTFTIDGKAYNFRGTLTLVPADNLASHYLEGYKSMSISSSMESNPLRALEHTMAYNLNCPAR